MRKMLRDFDYKKEQKTTERQEYYTMQSSVDNVFTVDGGTQKVHPNAVVQFDLTQRHSVLLGINR